MGVDVESKLADLAHVSVENGSDNNGSLKENGSVHNEPIKFGSHGTEEPIKEEVIIAPEINLPKDAVVEDWPEPQQIHSFYFVKYRPFEDQKLKAKLELAEKELQKKNQARGRMIDNLKAKKAARSELINERKSLGAERQQYWSQIDEKRKEMQPLQQALGRLRGTNAGGRDRGSVIFSSEAELNGYIKSLEYRIQHESILLNEEKQILREIKQLEGTREKVIAHALERAKIEEQMGEKESIQTQVKLIGVDMDGVRKEKQVLSSKLKEIDDELDSMKKDIGLLEDDLTALAQQRDKTYESILELRKQREEGNASFFKYRKLNFEVRQLADKKDIAALKELCDTEVDKFMSQWSSSKSFREDYEKRILQSLDMRLLGKDGRMRNPQEKPLVQPEAPTLPATEVLKTNQKPSKEDSGPPSQPDASMASKAQKEKNSKEPKDGKSKTTKSSLDVNAPNDDEEEIPDLPKESTVKKAEVDEETLKQTKREQEIAKYKQAIERKKKKEEKAAAKAELRAQKEAEKKLKGREKRAKKKGGGATDESTDDPSEITTEDAEPEKPEEKVETAVEPKSKEGKPSTLKQRTRSKGSSDIHKVILKRKKSTNYWLWAGPAAAVAILLLLAVGYKFFA